MPSLPAPAQRSVREVVRPGLTLVALLAALLLALTLLGSHAEAVTAPEPAAPETGAGVQTELPEIGQGGLPVPPGLPLPAEAPSPVTPGLPDLGGTGESALNSPLLLVLLLGAVSLIPALLIMATAFTRIVIVLGFVRSALGTNGIPPNQVILGLALFLSFFVMAPTFTDANETALQPLMRGEISQEVALERGVEPFREFMLKQVREEDLALFVRLSGDERPENADAVPTTTLAPAFLLSELRTAFLIGFVIFIPFIIIDLIVSAALSAMGMMMLPPVLISLPFKLLLFVAADGWSLVVESLLGSFAT